MGVVVRGDRAQVVVDPQLAVEVTGDDLGQPTVQLGAHVIGRGRIVGAPHDHRHRAALALGDPAQLVIVEPLGEWRRLAQLTPRIE